MRGKRVVNRGNWFVLSLMTALLPLVNAITDEMMRDANMRVDVERQPVGTAATWLLER